MRIQLRGFRSENKCWSPGIFGNASVLPVWSFGVIAMLGVLVILCAGKSAASTPSNLGGSVKGEFRGASPDPDYEPPLPQAIPFNSEQIQLLNQSPPLENYIRFVEPTDKDASTFAVAGQPLKKWSKPEKKDVRQLLQYVFDVTPGLIIHAASGGQVAIARTAAISVSKPLSTMRQSSYNAVAGPSSIVLCDIFFVNNHQCDSLVHELVHAADCGGLIAYSKEWVDFTQPTVSKMRIRVNFLSVYENRNLSKSLDRGDGEWVSLYGCENLNEALAEYATTCINKREYHHIDPNFVRVFANRLIMPVSQDLNYGRYYKLGRNAIDHYKFDEAIELLRSSITFAPNATLAHSGLAVALEATGQYDQALVECQLAEACFEKAGVPLDDRELGYLLERKAMIALDKDNYELALSTLDKLLFNDPLDRDGLLGRVKAEDCLNRPALAAIDLYEYSNERNAGDFVVTGAFDPDFTMQMLDADVKRFSALGAPAARRARFLESLGDVETDSAKKMQFFDRALTDFKKTLGKIDCSESRSYLDCGRLSFKLGQPEQIRLYMDKFVSVDDGDEKAVLQILLLESTGKHEEAEVLFRNLKSKLCPSGTNDKNNKKDRWDYVTERLRVPISISFS